MFSAIRDVFPPAPTFTEKDLPNLEGKIIIITGAASGVGYELAKILYEAGGTVYIVARSTHRCEEAIKKIKSKSVVSKDAGQGQLKSLPIDLADLRTVKPAVHAFLRSEKRLDVLVHNAGVMEPAAGSKDVLGHDLEIGVNCLAPYLLTTLLEPLIRQTAIISPPSSTRIIWVATMLQAGGIPKAGMLFDEDGTPKLLKGMENYFQSKVGNVWLGKEFAKRLGSLGILSLTLHPGLITTELQRRWGPVKRASMSMIMGKDPIYGAYTELFAAFSPDLTAKQNGAHLTAWGRMSSLPDAIVLATKSKSEGGNGNASRFLAYCDKEVKPHA